MNAFGGLKEEKTMGGPDPSDTGARGRGSTAGGNVAAGAGTRMSGLSALRARALRYRHKADGLSALADAIEDAIRDDTADNDGGAAESALWELVMDAGRSR